MRDITKGTIIKTLVATKGLAYEAPVEEVAIEVAGLMHTLYSHASKDYPGHVLLPGLMEIVREPLYEGLIFRATVDVMRVS